MKIIEEWVIKQPVPPMIPPINREISTPELQLVAGSNVINLKLSDYLILLEVYRFLTDENPFGKCEISKEKDVVDISASAKKRFTKTK